MPDVDEIVSKLEEDGYAVIENHLSPADVQRKRDDLARILASNPTGRNDFEGFSTQRIYAVFAKTRTFDAQATDPLILGVLERILGGGFQLSAPVGISIGPGEKAQPIHRDDGVYPVRRPHRELVVNTMWALDDFTEANGATVVIPGSHRWVDEQPTKDSPVVRAVMPAGSVMLFVGSIYHGGGANTTDRARLGVILEFCAGWVRPQENHILGVPKQIVKDLDPKLQELLGYSVLGLLGNVDGRNPKKYIEDARTVNNGVIDLGGPAQIPE